MYRWFWACWVLLRAWDEALIPVDGEACRRAPAELDRGIKTAKQKYKQRNEENFKAKDPCNVLRDISNNADYKQATTPLLQSTLSSPESVHLLTLQHYQVKWALGREAWWCFCHWIHVPTSAALFRNMFNMSLQQVTVPTCLKTATIIPVPETSAVTSLKDYRLVALLGPNTSAILWHPYLILLRVRIYEN